MDTNSLKTLLRSVILGQVNGSDQAAALDIYEKICSGELVLTSLPTASSNPTFIFKNCIIGNREVSESSYNAIMDAYRTGNKIATIKVVRAELNMPLKDAKDFVENPTFFKQNWRSSFP